MASGQRSGGMLGVWGLLVGVSVIGAVWRWWENSSFKICEDQMTSTILAAPFDVQSSYWTDSHSHFTLFTSLAEKKRK
jgi:hypothetical protein